MSPRRKPGTLLIAAAVLAVVAIWLLPAATRPSASGTAEPPVEEAAPPCPAPVPSIVPARSPAPAAPEVTHVADDGLPFMPAGPNEPRPNGPVHPHPITPQHQRIYRENRLIAALDGAMDVGDVAALRRFLDEYRAAYPEDDHELQDGYAIIATCIERRGEESRAAALSWADAHRGSTLRRFVTRHCL